MGSCENSCSVITLLPSKCHVTRIQWVGPSHRYAKGRAVRPGCLGPSPGLATRGSVIRGYSASSLFRWLPVSSRRDSKRAAHAPTFLTPRRHGGHWRSAVVFCSARRVSRFFSTTCSGQTLSVRWRVCARLNRPSSWRFWLR